MPRIFLSMLKSAAVAAGAASGVVSQTVRAIACVAVAAYCGTHCLAQFEEEFDAQALAFDAEGIAGWSFLAGDGEADIDFRQEDGVGIVEVDAREDRRNIWWAVIRRSVSSQIDQSELARPDRELRVEARIRSSHAPRRVNLHFNHSRTQDFHSFLKEFDIPDADRWQVISMTTDGFDARSDDEVFVQLALMDWGRETYRLEVDYLKVEVVDPEEVGPDRGEPLPYRPEPRPLSDFSIALPAIEDATVDRAYPWVNMAGWSSGDNPDGPPLFSISGTQIALMRWDLSDFQGRVTDGWGLLELTAESVHWAETELEEFGELRVVEILEGDPDWERSSVTLRSFTEGEPIDAVLNGQMAIDLPPSKRKGSKTYLPIAPPVLNRLLSGRTKGLAMYPQGALNAVFYSAQGEEGLGPKLYFSVSDEKH